MISILIPSIPQRFDRLKELMNKYDIYATNYEVDVEIISIIDNKRMTVGAKRNALVGLAKGDYWVMTDDDADELTETYFKVIKEYCTGVDVITYLQEARINDDKTTVEFGLKNINEEFNTGGLTKRKAWHCCTWRKEAVIDSKFHSGLNWGEDSFFADAANEQAKTSIHIPQVCHIYQHDSHVTAAFQ